MGRESLLLVGMLFLLSSCSPTKEEQVIRFGQMIIDSEIESMQLDDSIRRTHCEGMVIPTYVLIKEVKEFDGLELFIAYISETGEDVDMITKYKGRIIAICYAEGKRDVQIPADSCGYLSFDEREWFMLYDMRHNRFVAVKSEWNLPPENILQLNQRNWSMEIQEAMLDTTVPCILPQEPSGE